MQYEVYVAFSIHGTRAFITANKKVEFHTRPKVNSNVHVDGLDFKVGNSRTVSLRDGIKLLSKELEAFSGCRVVEKPIIRKDGSVTGITFADLERAAA